jgi:hypothetical protein
LDVTPRRPKGSQQPISSVVVVTMVEVPMTTVTAVVAGVSVCHGRGEVVVVASKLLQSVRCCADWSVRVPVTARTQLFAWQAASARLAARAARRVKVRGFIVVALGRFLR